MDGRRGHAVLWTCNVTPCPEQAEILARDLAAIGIDVDVKAFPKPVLYALVSRANAAYDIVTAGWIADYPDPASVLGPLSNPRHPQRRLLALPRPTHRTRADGRRPTLGARALPRVR